jgi:hypothetical protein
VEIPRGDMMLIEDILEGMKDKYKIYEHKSFVLYNGERYHTLYFKQDFKEKDQYKLWSDDVWNGLRVQRK